MNKNEQSSALVIVWAMALLVAILMLIFAGNAKGQSNTCNNGDMLLVNTGGNKNNQCLPVNSQPAGTGTTMIVANDTVTGTTVNRLAKLTGAPSKALITATSDTENAVGIVTSGAGTTGNATITIIGQASCEFDGATTAGNYFIISATTAGKCHDGGSAFPTSGATYGRVLSTNGGAGTYIVEIMTPDIAFQNAGNGKSKPGTPANSYQYNNSNTFGGGELTRVSSSATRLSNGATTMKLSSCVDCSSEIIETVMTGNSGSGYSEVGMERGSTSSSCARLIARNGMSTTPGTNAIEICSGGSLHPISSIDLGDNGATRWNNVWAQSYFANTTQFVLGNANSSSVPMIKAESGSNYARIRRGDDGADAPLSDFSRTHTSSQFDKSSNTTLANITGLTTGSNMLAGKTYRFEAVLFIDADVTGGSKYAIGGTATATDIKYYVNMICDASNLNVITSRQTALGGSVGQAGCTAGLTRITGSITVNAAGTLTVQFAQNASSGTSSVLTMSTFRVEIVNDNN